MLGRDLVVRVQAFFGIELPELHRLAEEFRRRRGHGFPRRGGRDLLPVARTAVGQDLAHDARAAAAYVALVVRQKLIQQLQGPPLVGPGHIGAELLEQLQIGADAVQILLAAGAVEQLAEAHVPGHGVHQADVVLQCELAQSLQALLVGEQGRAAPRRSRRAMLGEGRAHAAVDQQALEVLQLVVDGLVAQLLFRRHVVELGEDHVVALGQVVDPHDLPPVLPGAAHAEVRVDQNQRFQAQIFKFEIPGGVVGRDVGDLGQALLGEPLVREIIVQIRDPGGVFAAAAEFSEVVGQRGGADQRDVHGQAGLLRLPGDVQGQIVHADGVGGRVEGHGLPAQPHQRHEARRLHGPAEQRILLRDQAAGLLGLAQRRDVAQRIGGAAARLRLQKPVQHGQEELHRLRLRPAQGAPGRVREDAVGQLVVALPQPALLRFGAERVHHRPAPAQQLRAADPLRAERGGQGGEKAGILQQRAQRLLGQAIFPEPAVLQPIQQSTIVH